MKRNKLRWGASGDAVLLTFIKLVTIAVSFVVTRLLSEYLTVHDYGTYSQVLLLVSTVTSLTILGMADGVNYFYCSKSDVQERERYISTIFALQCIVSAVAGTLVMALTSPICTYFDNPKVQRLLIFAATLPLLQNLLSMVQVLLVSVGKARMLAVRNLTVSILRLAAVVVVVTLVRNVAIILATTLIMDVAQVLIFGFVLRKNRCGIRLRSVNLRLLKTILRYCAPMAVFTALNTLSRDCDKYLIALWTDTETVAMYSNASKILPFDIVVSSFCTVLLPQITRLIAAHERTKATELYQVFLEITYISTTILCCAALACAPQLMRLLYSEKYVDGLAIFCVYIAVDLLRFTNITLILSAAGKTKKLMLSGFAALAVNAALNVVLFWLFGITGPAVATLLTTLGLGIWMLWAGARELEARLSDFFRWKYLFAFMAENAVATAALCFLQGRLAAWDVPYIAIIAIVCGLYAGIMLLLHGKRLLSAMKQVNQMAKQDG